MSVLEGGASVDEQPPAGPTTPALRDMSAVLERITDRLAVRHRSAFSHCTVG